MRSFLSLLILVLALTGLPASGFAAETAPAALPPGVEKIASVEGITEYRLPNRLRILLAPDDSKPTTTVNITYLVGSRHESYGETGMAHLLEHLMFKGTPDLPDGALVAELKKRGMQFNGSTWFDRTNYYETFAASDDNLDWALAMEADRMVNSFIARADLDTEMTVVRNEMEAGENSPFRILWQKLGAAAYQWHNYGKSTIGARSDVENVDIAKLQAFYRAHYQPDNAVLVVAGKLDVAGTLTRIVQHFGAIPRSVRVQEPTYTVEPVQDGGREVTLERVGDTQWIATLYHTVPGTHPDMAALRLLAFILSDAPSGRLHKALVQTRRAASVDALPMELAEPGYIAFFVQVPKGKSREAARRILIDKVEHLARHPVTDAELKRAKLALANGYEDVMNDPSHFGVALSEEIAQGDWRFLFIGRDRVEAATAADLQRVAQNYFKPSNRTFGQFIPVDKPDRVLEVPMKPAAEQAAGYLGRAAVEAGESFDPAPANIEARTRRIALRGGLSLALLPKKTRGATVNGFFSLRMGDEKSLRGMHATADAVADLLAHGAGGMSRQQIADALDALKATLSIGTSDGNVVSVSFETRRQNLPKFLDLLGTILRRPEFPASELEEWRTQNITAIDGARREPQAVASRALGRHDNPYPKGDPRYVGTVDEDIAAVRAVTRAELQRFHARFYGASHAQFALVGDFDAAAAQAQIADLFGKWKSPVPYARIPQPFRPDRPATLMLETPDKANAFYLGGFSIPLRDDAADWPALAIGSEILGGGGLKSRLADRLRQKDGLSYGVGSVLRGQASDANASMLFYAIYAPQNRVRLQKGFTDEIERLLRDGVTDAEVDAARNGLLQEMTISRTRDGALAGLLASQQWLGRTMQFTADREAKLRALDAAAVNAALRSYLKPEALVNVYAGDFAKTAVTQ